MVDTAEQKIDELIAIAGRVKTSLNRRTVFFMVLVLVKLVFLILLFDVAQTNKANGDLLIECTTPGTNPNARAVNETGNACWDRLHAPGGTDAAVALIVDNIYCDHRRAQAKLPPVSDPKKSCREQTDSEILNGSK